MRIFIVLLTAIPFFALADSHTWVNHPIILSGSEVEPVEYTIDEFHHAIETEDSIQKNKKFEGESTLPEKTEAIQQEKTNLETKHQESSAIPTINKNYVHKAQWFPFPYLRPSNACSAGCFTPWMGYAGNPCQCVFWNGFTYYTLWGYLY